MHSLRLEKSQPSDDCHHRYLDLRGTARFYLFEGDNQKWALYFQIKDSKSDLFIYLFIFLEMLIIFYLYFLGKSDLKMKQTSNREFKKQNTHESADCENSKFIHMFVQYTHV